MATPTLNDWEDSLLLGVAIYAELLIKIGTNYY